MRIRFLTIAVALACVFAGQQAVAKDSTKNAATNKKHHKKHTKKTGKTAAASRTAPTAEPEPVRS